MSQSYARLGLHNVTYLVKSGAVGIHFRLIYAALIYLQAYNVFLQMLMLRHYPLRNMWSTSSNANMVNEIESSSSNSM